MLRFREKRDKLVHVAPEIALALELGDHGFAAVRITSIRACSCVSITLRGFIENANHRVM
jgi:hypothetical protein